MEQPCADGRDPAGDRDARVGEKTAVTLLTLPGNTLGMLASNNPPMID